MTGLTLAIVVAVGIAWVFQRQLIILTAIKLYKLARLLNQISDLVACGADAVLRVYDRRYRA